MAQNCFLCKKKCEYNDVGYYASRKSQCKKAKELKEICNSCSYAQNCKKNSKGLCAQYRKNEIAEMRLKTNKKILEYLECVYFDNCPNKSIDLMDLATELAESEWYSVCHSNDDWRSFAKQEGINKSESEHFKEDVVPEFIPEAKKIIKAKELENPSLTLSNVKNKTEDCVNCPPKFKNSCVKNSLPDGWVGFPDLYIQEALRRRIIGDFIQR